MSHICVYCLLMSELWLSKSRGGGRGGCSLVGRFHRCEGIFSLHLECIITIEIRAEFTYLPNHKIVTQKDSNITELGPPNNIEVLQLISHMIYRMHKPNYQSRWPCGLRRGSAFPRLPSSRVRIPPRSWLSRLLCLLCVV